MFNSIATNLGRAWVDSSKMLGTWKRDLYTYMYFRLGKLRFSSCMIPTLPRIFGDFCFFFGQPKKPRKGGVFGREKGNPSLFGIIPQAKGGKWRLKLARIPKTKSQNTNFGGHWHFGRIENQPIPKVFQTKDGWPWGMVKKCKVH